MKMKFLLCVFFLIVSVGVLIGSEFENEYNHCSGMEIKRFKVCGERCSGTNFLDKLLSLNFPSISTDNTQRFGHKHFFRWFEAPINPMQLKTLIYPPTESDLSTSQDCLFVVIIRNPYDWLRSFYLKPHHVHDSISQRGFLRFLSGEWKSSFDQHSFKLGEIEDFNPWTGKPFSNVLELRKYKTINYLRLGSLVENYLFVRYEDVRDNPKKFINFVSDFYNMAAKDRFIAVKTYKGKDKVYVEKVYPAIRKNELNFINSHLDWEVENAAGYTPILLNLSRLTAVVEDFTPPLFDSF